MIDNNQWLYEIKPKSNLLEFNFQEIWRYRDLLILFVRRDVVTVYKQTILGPLWYLIQPLLTSVIFTLIFNNVAGIETGGIPPFLFNLAGITIWTYFKECLTQTSNTFTANAAIFGKVYFPRVVLPMSKIISNLVKLGIQLLIFLTFYCYFVIVGGGSFSFQFEPELVLFPVLIVAMGLIGLGLGMVLSAMTTKYRDLSILVTFGVQLLMYLSAVMYPLEELREKAPDYYWILKINPLAQIIEAFRYMTMSSGNFSLLGVFGSLGFAVIIFLIGLAIFNKTEKSFVDTV